MCAHEDEDAALIFRQNATTIVVKVKGVSDGY